MEGIEVIKSIIERGILEVRPDGEIWKRARMTSHAQVVPIVPKRAECKLKNGYLGVKVCANNKQYLMLAHRVVWSVLVGEIPKRMDINHKDGNKTNNNPRNLESVTRNENLRHASITGLRTYPKVMATVVPDAQLLRKQGMSYAAIAKALKISQTTAFRAVQNKKLLF